MHFAEPRSALLLRAQHCARARPCPRPPRPRASSDPAARAGSTWWNQSNHHGNGERPKNSSEGLSMSGRQAPNTPASTLSRFDGTAALPTAAIAASPISPSGTATRNSLVRLATPVGYRVEHEVGDEAAGERRSARRARPLRSPHRTAHAWSPAREEPARSGPSNAVRIVDRRTTAVDAPVDEPVDDVACPGDNSAQVVDILGMTKQF